MTSRHLALLWAPRARLGRWLVLPVLLVTASATPAVAQAVAESSGDLENVELTVEQIVAERAEVMESVELPAEIRTRAVESYDTAVKSLEAVRAFAAEAVRFDQEASLSEARIKALQAELDETTHVEAPTLPEDVTSAQIEEQLTQARAELAAARQALRDEDRLSAQRSTRRREISTRLGTLNQRLVQVDDDVRQMLLTEPYPELREARQTSLLARRRAMEAEIVALRAELNRHVARAPTLPLRRKRANRRVLAAQETLDLLVEAARSVRVAEMRQELADTRRISDEVARGVPALAPLAAETVELAQMLSGSGGMRMRAEDAVSELSAVRKSISEIRQAFEASRRKWEVVGYRGVATQWWPSVPIDLGRPGTLRREIRERESQIPEIQHQLILLEEKRVSSSDILRELLGDAAEREVGEVAQELLNRRRELLDDLISRATQYTNLLYELDLASRELLAELEALEAFVTARVMWTRSVPGSTLPAIGDIAGGFVWLFGNRDWPAVLRETLERVQRMPLVALCAVGFIALLFWIRQWCQSRLERLAGRVADSDLRTLEAPAKALGLTVLLATPYPLLLLLLSSVVGLAEQYEIARAAAAGLYACSMLATTLAFVASACRPRGLMEAHFGWAAGLTSAIHRNARLAIVLVLPFVFASFAFHEVGMRFYHPLELRTWNNALGRVCFAVAFVVISIFSYRALRPVTESSSQRLLASRWTRPLRSFAVWLFVAPLLAPAVLTLLGYYVTAALLVPFLFRSVWLVLGLVLLTGFLHSWETARRRHLATARLPNENSARAKNGIGGAQADSVEKVETGLTVADAQVRQLLRFGVLLVGVVGILVIWARFVPALRVLDQVQVWPSFQFLTEQELAQRTDPEVVPEPAKRGSAGAEPMPNALPLTPGTPTVITSGPGAVETSTDESSTAGVGAPTLMLSELLVALLLMMATTVTAKNIPGLLEFAVLPRAQVDAGVSVAVGTLVRYGILIVGFGIAFALLGLGWSKIQWLAAALTFGLAFGLQEIFANFISGLILLVERPIRVGDAVTIGTITGRVARIRMRATTIVGWDKSELIVPNKEFITGQLVNWTLSDPRVRVEVPVGVAYGSDTQKVKATLIEVARRHPLVLSDPEPEALFLAFGPSTLDFELRVFIDFSSGRLRVRDELQIAIDRAFRDRGIAIAFPQMDIHVKTASAAERPSEHTRSGSG